VSENLNKAKDFVEAYNRRDFDKAMEWFDPAVEWILPERQSSDSCVGRKPIRRFWEGIDEHFDDLRLLPQEWLDAGERVATRLRHHGLGKGSGVELDQELYHQVITFRDGWMVRIEYFGEWQEALEAARAPDRSAPAAHRTQT
jgi:ketosteroid isomerase-like protein